MKAVLIVVLVALYLCLLWGPALWVGRKLWRAGHAAALLHLRKVLPAQLVATVVLLLVADAAGLQNPIGLLIAITLAVSIAGAALYAVMMFFKGARLR